jgi:hypothetical protein
VWNYNFVPHSNLVDLHMGRLRRKIDQSAESEVARKRASEHVVFHSLLAPCKRRRYNEVAAKGKLMGHRILSADPG